MDADILRDLSDHLEHGGLAAAGAEERKHVDRTVDRPIDVLVDHGFEIVELVFVDRTMQRARERPEAVLCHVGAVLT
jgi:NADPH-dependent glutamate synthase beta subunit-like oxidoreductase